MSCYVGCLPVRGCLDVASCTSSRTAKLGHVRQQAPAAAEGSHPKACSRPPALSGTATSRPGELCSLPRQSVPSGSGRVQHAQQSSRIPCPNAGGPQPIAMRSQCVVACASLPNSGVHHHPGCADTHQHPSPPPSPAPKRLWVHNLQTTDKEGLTNMQGFNSSLRHESSETMELTPQSQ